MRFALAEDRAALVRFAPLQSSVAQTAEIAATQRSGDTFVVAMADGTLRVRGDAVIALLAALGGYWRIVCVLLRCVPRQLRDAAYDMVGKRRLRLFGSATTLCPLVAPEYRARFLAGD